MELWNLWIAALHASLSYFTAHFGLSEAASIIVLTLIARFALMPISLTGAFRMCRNREVLEKLKSKLDEIRKAYKDNPSELAQRTMQLYRDNGVTFFDRVSLLNIGTQSFFGIGMYQCLKQAAFSSRFLWIASLAKPDLLLTVLIAGLMLVTAVLMPEATANTSMLLMVVIPILVSIVAIAALPSALGVYWATSNAVTVIQTLVLRGMNARAQHPTT